MEGRGPSEVKAADESPSSPAPAPPGGGTPMRQENPPVGFSRTEPPGGGVSPAPVSNGPEDPSSGTPAEVSPLPGASTSPASSSGEGGPVGGPIHVQFENEEVSLLAENRSFSDVLSAVAEKAQFSVKIPPDLGARRISVALQAVPLERAIVRLFTLVQEKNYTVRYGQGGRIARIEVVHEKRSPTAASRGRQMAPSRPSAGIPPKPAPANAGFRPPQPILQPPPYIPPTDPLAEPDEDTGTETQGSQ